MRDLWGRLWDEHRAMTIFVTLSFMLLWTVTLSYGFQRLYAPPPPPVPSQSWLPPPCDALCQEVRDARDRYVERRQLGDDTIGPPGPSGPPGLDGHPVPRYR